MTGAPTRPGKVSLAGAGVVLLPAVQDTALKAAMQSVDSLVRPAPGSDRITPIIQWLFQRSPWVMWGGVVLGLIVLSIVLGWGWPRRKEIGQWLVSRSRNVKLALVGAAVAAVALATTAGYQSYQFVETDKRFCNGCHIFVASGQRFVTADSGNYTIVPMLEGKHDSLGCHTCHPLKPMKEAVKLLFWMSGFREKEIPPHARVPRQICEQCHVRGRAEDKDRWKAIAATAGHRIHLESDSSALKGKVECLTCHALTAHRFPPADSTCGQSNCHKVSETRIILGKMKDVGDFHCVGCHQFTAYVPALATRDSAASTLVPAIKSCFRCHAMQQRLPDFDERKDPHKGTCGMCHDPHTQTRPAETVKTCSTRECHGLWNQIPFHYGAQHRGKAQQCTLCHPAHAARVDAADCVGCHQRVRDYAPGQRLFPPLPFDTLEALRHSLAPEPPVAKPERPNKVKGDAPPSDDSPGRALSARRALPSDSFSHPRRRVRDYASGQRLFPPLPFDTLEALRHSLAPEPPVAKPERPNKVKGDAPPWDDPPRRGVSALPALPSDTFAHPLHKKLACLTCHLSTSGSKLTFEPPRGCQICHHQNPARTDCARCHEEGSLPEVVAVQVSIAAAGKPERERTVAFRHERHADLHCIDCHGQPVSLAPVDSAVSCQGCHEKHHEANRDCATCHRTASITVAHARPARVHVACDACHATAAIAALKPTRSLCLACHGPAVDHNPKRECSSCHLQAPPDQYRARLLKRGQPG